MSDKEILNPQHSDQKKPVSPSDVTVPPKQEIPGGQPKAPQPVQEKPEEKKKPA